MPEVLPDYPIAIAKPPSAIPLAIGAGLVAAALELPFSLFYKTVPSTTTAKRMVIAGGMVFTSVMVASWIGRRYLS
jgi:hypothetical protein